MARFLFDTTLTPAPLTVAANNQLVLALGATTIVYLTSSLGGTVSIISLTAATGNVDGMVVCFSNISPASQIFGFDNESPTEPVLTARFRSNATISIVQYGAVWYRWSAASQRWQAMSKV